MMAQAGQYNPGPMLDTAFLSDTLCPVRGEVALWRAVIVQALMDAASASGKQEMQQSKQEAIRWLLRGGEDFSIVCEMAEMNPERVREQAVRALENGCVWRNDPRLVARALKKQKKTLGKKR